MGKGRPIDVWWPHEEGAIGKRAAVSWRAPLASRAHSPAHALSVATLRHGRGRGFRGDIVAPLDMIACDTWWMLGGGSGTSACARQPQDRPDIAREG
jgi:hypothetical protein